eukprot:5625255-Amphidinium_carterae.1
MGVGANIILWHDFSKGWTIYESCDRGSTQDDWSVPQGRALLGNTRSEFSGSYLSSERGGTHSSLSEGDEPPDPVV